MPTTSDPGPSHRPIQGNLQLLQHPQWSHIPWLAHGFSTRHSGLSTVYSQNGRGELNLGFTSADNREAVLRNRQLLLQELSGSESGARLPDARLKVLSQIHSPTVHTVHGSEEVPPGDGMVTATPGVYLAIQTADCVPVLLVDTKRRLIGAVHAGWRGTVKRIVEVEVEKMRQDFASDPEDISALIGPSIDPCCYNRRRRTSSGIRYGVSLLRRALSHRGNWLRTQTTSGSGRGESAPVIESGVRRKSIHRRRQLHQLQSEAIFLASPERGKYRADDERGWHSRVAERLRCAVVLSGGRLVSVRGLLASWVHHVAQFLARL